MSPLNCSRQAGRHSRRGHSPINGIFRQRNGRSPHHTEDSWRVFQLSGYTSTAAMLHINAKSVGPARKTTKGPEPFCVFYDSRSHWAQDCKKITDVTKQIERLKKANWCFLCLNQGHIASNCGKKGTAKCARCRKSHYISVCDDGNKAKAPAAQTNFTSEGRISPGFTYIQTAQVWITGPMGLSRLTHCVLDGGSQSRFIAAPLIDNLKLQAINEQELTVCAFESPSTQSSRHRLIRFDMKGVWTHSTASHHCVREYPRTFGLASCPTRR